MRRWWLAALVVMVAGCAVDWNRMVVDTASRDHGCPMSRVHVISDNGDGMARLVELDVCGRRRVYRDVGGTRMYLFVDTTPESAGDDAPSAGPSRYTGGTAGDEREREREPTDRHARADRREEERRRGREHERERERAAADERRDEPTAPREETAFDRRIRASIETARTGILVCTGGAAAVVARWDPSDLRVTFTVRDADSATSGCVQTAIGEVLVDPSQPGGNLMHPIIP